MSYLKIAAIYFGFLALLSTNCGQPDKSSPIQQALAAITPCPKEANLAVLNKLHPVLGYIGVNPTVRNLDRADTEIACIREWAKSLKDDCARSNYADWLDYFADRSKETRRDIISGEPASSTEKYLAERREEKARIAAYEKAHPVEPPPPSCSVDLIKTVRP